MKPPVNPGKARQHTSQVKPSARIIPLYAPPPPRSATRIIPMRVTVRTQGS